MAKQSSTQSRKSRNTSLTISREDVREELATRIAKGSALLRALEAVATPDASDHATTTHKKWDRYNAEYLSRAFDSDAFAQEYNWATPTAGRSYGGSVKARQLRESLVNQLASLESIVERLDLIPECDAPDPDVASRAQPTSRESVFVVHGHDTEAKETVARFVEKFGLDVIVLHEMANGGSTIIEKFEQHAIRAGFALVLLTPDDIGSSAAEPDKRKPRARQNVVLELGYFVGALGRSRVQVLHKADVEIPSDLLGVLYTPLDSSETWKLAVARELKHAGFDVDLNDAL